MRDSKSAEEPVTLLASLVLRPVGMLVYTDQRHVLFTFSPTGGFNDEVDQGQHRREVPKHKVNHTD